jgi:hypothetical protein
MEMLTHNFVTPEGEKALLKFKYRGRDDSPLYKYVYGAAAELLVKYILPKWLAPNIVH